MTQSEAAGYVTRLPLLKLKQALLRAAQPLTLRRREKALPITVPLGCIAWRDRGLHPIGLLGFSNAFAHRLWLSECLFSRCLTCCQHHYADAAEVRLACTNLSPETLACTPPHSRNTTTHTHTHTHLDTQTRTHTQCAVIAAKGNADRREAEPGCSNCIVPRSGLITTTA